MQAKQSFTASEYGSSEPRISALSSRAYLPAGPACEPPWSKGVPLQSAQRSMASVHDEGLIHDARNLVGALGLYCDLLSMPGVLEPRHRHYAEEVRLLGERSAAMIQRLMEHRVQMAPNDFGPGLSGKSNSTANPVSLRSIIERCSGILSRVACGAAIEIHYGPAAAVPVSVDQEEVERILVNLVRNGAAALRDRTPADPSAGHRIPGQIRIGVGLLTDRIGPPKPWPFRYVRLTVEDSGCGMAQAQVDALLTGTGPIAHAGHGIGFRVVRELVAASSADLTVMSTPGAGTRVQIEWPAAASSVSAGIEGGSGAGVNVEERLSC